MISKSHIIIRANKETLLATDIDALVADGWRLQNVYGVVKNQDEQHFAVMVKENSNMPPIITNGRELPHGLTP